jgi:hypothetical protein
MLIPENEKKVVKIGRVKNAFVIADDDVIDAMYYAYEKHLKLGRKEISFDTFCISYIEGRYDHIIRQGWTKYE